MAKDFINAQEVAAYAATNAECNRLKKERDSLAASLRERLKNGAECAITKDKLTLTLQPSEVRLYSDSEILAAILPELPVKVKKYVQDQQVKKSTQYSLKAVQVSVGIATRSQKVGE